MSQLGTVYATKRRRRNGKSLKPPPKDGVTKSNPSKRHRERLNAELDLLASLLPFEQNILSKLDRLSILRLSVSYLRTKSYFQVVMHKEKEENGMIHIHHQSHDSYRNREIGIFENGLLDADMFLQALNGFLMILTCEGEVFFATHSIESYLGFHQSDIVHQSVYELVHSEDREELQRQLLWNSFLPPDLSGMSLSDALTPEKINYLERSFTVRFRCLLDNTSGFLRLDIRGRVKILHGQNRKTEEPPLGLFAFCTPFGPPSLLEIPQKENMFKSKHKLDLSLVSMDQRGKLMLGYSDSELAALGGYDLVHYDDLSYIASAHQELLKTGASGMIAYRFQKKDGEWQWLQTSSRLVYKNSKPDFVICTHRQLMDEEGRDLLGKRTMDFKVSYLDTGLSSSYFTEADQLLVTPTNGVSPTAITNSSGSTAAPRTNRRYKTQLRDFLSTCRSKRKVSQHANQQQPPTPTTPNQISTKSPNSIVEFITDPAVVAAAYSNLNPIYSPSPYAPSSTENIYMSQTVHSGSFYPTAENLFHQYRLQGSYYPEYHHHHHHPSSPYVANGFLPYESYNGAGGPSTKEEKWQEDNKYYGSELNGSIETSPPPPTPSSAAAVHRSFSDQSQRQTVLMWGTGNAHQTNENTSTATSPSSTRSPNNTPRSANATPSSNNLYHNQHYNNNNNNNNNSSNQQHHIQQQQKYSASCQTQNNCDGQNQKKSSEMPDSTDVIGNVLGPFGKFQLRTILLIFLVKIPSSWFMACIIFTAPSPQHGEIFCSPPIQNMSNKINNWVKIAHPMKEEVKDQEFAIDFCNVFKDAHQHVLSFYNDSIMHDDNLFTIPAINTTQHLIPCESFEHHSDYESIITQFDLVCSRDILVAVTQFFHLFGVLCGGCLAVFMLNYISPRRVMLIGMVTQIICGNLTGLVGMFELHMFFRCLSAVCCALMYTAGGAIFSDITAGKYRVSAICLFEQFWSIGVILLPGVASFWSSWTQLYMAISFPTLGLIIVHQWIPDSPRWLIKRNRVAEAKMILLEAARINGKTVSANDLEKQLQIEAAASLEVAPEPSWWSLWSTPEVTKNLIACHLAWSIYIVIYYGFLLNIRGFGREFLELNTVIAGVCEIIGTFIGLFLILKTSRKWLWTSIFNIVASFVALSAHLIPPTVTPNERVVLLMVTSMTAKISISTTLSILTTSTVELVSGEKKRLCGYSTIVWARIWLLTAPFVGATVVLGQLVPQTAMSILNIIGSLLTALINSPRTIPKADREDKSYYPSEIQPPQIWTVKYNVDKTAV
ncbi:unnamed protein product [Diamesa serratosioi]